MLEFKQTDTTADLILTLTELVSLPAPVFLFVFTHVLTKDVVAFIGTDTSLFTSRYNEFNINPSVVFANKQPGEWHYIIYEQSSLTNLDPLLTGAALEYGKMILDRDPAFSFTKYDTPTTYKTYNG